MSGGRREFLGLASAALLVPFGAPARAQSAGFAPPPGPMHFTRRLRREMVDGTAIEAERFFTIRFVPYSGGFRIEGGESGPPQITGPAQLEDFLRLERERSEAGLFPLTLDRTGRIVGEPSQAGSPQLDRAVEEALHLIAGRGLGADDQAAARTFLAGLQHTAGSLVAAPPAALFRPSSAPQNESREVALPGGRTGTIAVSFTAQADPATGLMREGHRLVQTRLGRSERRTAERWTLSPA